MMKKMALGFSLLALNCVAIAQETSTVVHPKWSVNASIYEANIRQHSPEGSFKKFESYLPELKKMGVGIIWIMPINPIGEKNRKGTLGSYYAVRDYKGVNPEFGTPADFKRLVDKTHSLGMKVIIDWVANHTAWDHPWASAHPDFYVRNEKGEYLPPDPDWHDVIKLDYSNKDVRLNMLDAMRFWVTEYNIDGFRCDVAEMVPTDFWNEARTELDKIKPVFMLAEGEKPDLHQHAFDMTYAWKLKNIFGDIAQGKKTASAINEYLLEDKKQYHANAYRMLHTSNHDLNSWEGTEFERLGNAAEAFLALSTVMEGMPLLYSGQEAGNTKRLDFFERDPIKWKPHPFKKIYSTLFNLKKSNQALWNGQAGAMHAEITTNKPNEILAFSRSKDKDTVVGIFNLSPMPQSFTFTSALPAGRFKNVFSSKNTALKNSATVNLKPWEYRILIKQ